MLQAPDIEAPTALAVAANGDVYYAEDPMDMSGPPTKNIDKIWLLPGGDPKKRKLVAEQMWAVMGLEVVRDKLFVVHPPYVSVFTIVKDGTLSKSRGLVRRPRAEGGRRRASTTTSRPASAWGPTAGSTSASATRASPR